MNFEFYYFLIVILLLRIIYQWKDKEKLEWKTHGTALIIEIALLFPLFCGLKFLLLLGLLLFYHISIVILDQTKINLFLKRMIEILLMLIISGFLFGTLLAEIQFNQTAIKVLNTVLRKNSLLSEIKPEVIKTGMFYLFGILMLINEWNNLIRYILGLIKTEPHGKEKESTTDEKELGKGKIIGIIERILFFFFVVTGNYASIGFILTAKGITRFKNLDDRDFAEYVLIGTLLSGSISIFWAYLIKLWIA